jgi:lipopolysaccharide transport system ATP-binding protein
LELGAGFNPEFTGRENVYMNGALMGFSREEMEKRSPDIEAFAEIGEYFDQPVRTYSSGMFVRLALAAAVNIDPEILVVDEALSVGDMYFQHRCISKMESFKAAGKTILLVTHDVNLVKTFCSTAILLNEGKILAHGDPEYVTEQYFMITKQRQVQFASTKFQLMQKSEPGLLGPKIRFGSEAGHIVDVRILDKEFRESVAFLAGDRIVIRIQVQVDPNVKIPNVGFILRDQRGYNIYGTDTQKLGVKLELDENHQATVLYTLSPVLAPGSYSFVVRLDDYTTPKITMLLDKQVGVGAFQVIENKTKFFGIVDLKAEAYQNMPECEERDR